MGLPQDNEAACHDGSPLFFADSLRGNLLAVHGSGDDNVPHQGTERLVNALVAANRPFTMMDYPNRSHCICEGRETPCTSSRCSPATSSRTCWAEAGPQAPSSGGSGRGAGSADSEHGGCPSAETHCIASPYKVGRGRRGGLRIGRSRP